MATVQEKKNNFCDEVYSELDGMKKKLLAMRDDLARTYRSEGETFGLYERHLCELVEQIDWKLQILSHACSYDWKGSTEYAENIVSVGPAEISPIDFAGGYIGG